MARWRGSGLTAREFAAEIGVNAHTLQHWAWRLRGAGEEHGAPSRLTEPHRAQDVEFIEVRTTPDDAAPMAMLEIVLSGGATIRVPARFDEITLRRVIAVLEAAP